MKAPLYNQKGEKVGELTLEKSIFEIEGKEGLVHRYLVYQEKSARRPIAHVRNKAAVRGGGKKPFAQKHTGRARQGSIRNPHMRGGGRAFGPKKWQNFRVQMPKGARRKALSQLLSKKAKDGRILALEKFELEKPKTKAFLSLLKKLPIERNVLVISNREEKTLKLSSRNLPQTKTILSGYLNPADLLTYETLLFTKTALLDLKYTK